MVPAHATARRLVINGRFLSQATTGVQRYAHEIVRAMDLCLAERDTLDGREVVLLAPPDARPFGGDLRRIRTVRAGRRGGQWWEQVELPRLARNDVLLSLANSGPLVHRRHMVCIHDAAVHATPENYSAAFRLWYRVLHRTLAHRARRLITVSAFSASEIERCYGHAADRIAIVPNSAEHIRAVVPSAGILERHGLRRGEYVFALGGTRSKNAAAVSRALRGLPEPRPRLVVAGRANGRVFGRHGDEGTGAGAVHLGAVSDGELKALYQGALCFVFPSRYEGFGIPPLEAMTCGCPVVVSRAASLPEACGAAALYCDPDDPDDIARAIAAVSRDPALRAALVRAGLVRAGSFRWQDSAARLLAHIALDLNSLTPHPEPGRSDDRVAADRCAWSPPI